MKKIITCTSALACLLFIISSIYSQTTIITDDGSYTTGEATAILDVKSTTKGLIIPRMTEKQRNDISVPAFGLLIFQIDEEPGFYFNASETAFPDWQRLKDGTSGQWNINGNDIYYIEGNVGIGTDEPTALLHTHGTGDGEGNVLFVGERKATPGEPPASDAGTRLMWYPDKAAFRVGCVSGSNWNMDSIGSCSVAMGFNPKSKGLYSTAIGFETYATGMVSSAFGDKTTASGKASSTMGHYTIASGDYSTAFGYKCDASGYISTALGRNTNASGDYSTAMGYYTNAKSAFETVIGRYNLDYTPNDTTGWNTIDRLFVIGNGISSAATSNAMTVLKNGRIGIGTDSPGAKLHLKGTSHPSSFMYLESDDGNDTGFRFYESSTVKWHIFNESVAGGLSIRNNQYKSALFVKQENAFIGIGTTNPIAVLHVNGTGDAEGNVLFTGNFKDTPGDPPTSGEGTRLMWYPDKAAFRVGRVSGTQWNKTNIGNYSIALGRNTTASAFYSTAMGYGTNASGFNSTTLGRNTTGSGDYSTAIGYGASASGWYSTAMGNNIISNSAYETVLGRWNVIMTGNSTSWDPVHNLFVIGNGTSAESRSNAITVRKNGTIGLQTITTPTFALHLPNSSYNGIGRARANAWTTYSDGRVKSDRADISYGLEEIMLLKPVKYFHHNSSFENGELVICKQGAEDIGFIAQEVYSIIPEIVNVPEDENTDLWGMNYEKLTPVMVKAIQEQQAEIDDLKKIVQQQQAQISSLINAINLGADVRAEHR